MIKKNEPIFGDDGFRSVYGKNFMTKSNIRNFAISVAIYIHKKKINKYPIILARDTRSSGVIIEKLLTKVFISSGINVVRAGILPTPGLSKLIELDNYCLGIMITASHNPANFNGIKIFSRTGYKMKAREEEVIEKLMREKQKIIKKKTKGFNQVINNSVQKYTNQILKEINFSLQKYKVAIDCSNGAMSFVAKELFSANKNILLVNNKPNGNNINDKCGALETKKLLKFIKKNKYDFGMAFDGDGDRAVFVSLHYGIIEPEKIFLLLCKSLSRNFKLDNIVVSEVFNYGIIKIIEKYFGNLWITKAGDRNIIEKIKVKNSLLGAEPSGHFNYPRVSKSMDGAITMILFLNLINKKNFYLDKELKKIKMYNRKIKNIDLSKFNKENINLKKLNRLCNNDNERILARTSMWEPVLRLYYDFKSRDNFYCYEKQISEILN